MKKLILLPVFLLLTQQVQAIKNDYNYAMKYCKIISEISSVAANYRVNNVEQDVVFKFFKDMENEEINSVGPDMLNQLVTEAYTLLIEFDEKQKLKAIDDFAEKKKNSCMEQTYKVEQNRFK